jgi:glycosyltransferase 2 family protein
LHVRRIDRKALRYLSWIVAAAVVVVVGRNLAHGVGELRTHPLPHSPNWGLVLLSGAVFLSGHAVLVQTWRSMLACWDARLPFWGAARIWSVSNLARYLPGKIWNIGAMGAMSRNVGVSPVAASGSAIISTLVNLIAGFAVAVIAGRTLLEQASSGRGAIAIVFVALASLTLLAAPWLMPRLAPVVARVVGRPVEATLPGRAVVYALVGNIVAWLLYGAAFELFVAGLLGSTTGGYAEYLAAYTISYIVGYLAFFSLAGLGFREGAMVTVLTFAGLATSPQAALIALTSRVWLTLLEVVPAFVFWTHAAVTRRPPTRDPSDVPT